MYVWVFSGYFPPKDIHVQVNWRLIATKFECESERNVCPVMDTDTCHTIGYKTGKFMDGWMDNEDYDLFFI